jgi:hypothetical protein
MTVEELRELEGYHHLQHGCGCTICPGRTIWH